MTTFQLSPPEWKCSECGQPYEPSFNSIKRANSYIREYWCYNCVKDTTIERIDKEKKNVSEI